MRLMLEIDLGRTLRAEEFEALKDIAHAQRSDPEDVVLEYIRTGLRRERGGLCAGAGEKDSEKGEKQ